MCDVLDDHGGSDSVRRRLITNFRFADDIVVNEEKEEAADAIADRLETCSARLKIEIGSDKVKVMTNNPNDTTSKER